MVYTITGTILKADNTPVLGGKVCFSLMDNKMASPAIVQSGQCCVLLDANGSFSITLHEGTYCVTLPNLTKFEFLIDSDKTLTLPL